MFIVWFFSYTKLPFILLVLSLTVYSSLSTPRIEQVPLVKVLRRDGALIFLASLLLVTQITSNSNEP